MKPPRRSLRIVVGSLGCPVRVRIEAFVSRSRNRSTDNAAGASVLKASIHFFLALVSVREVELYVVIEIRRELSGRIFIARDERVGEAYIDDNFDMVIGVRANIHSGGGGANRVLPE